MKNPTYYETVARNHARIAAMQDKRSRDLFANAPAGAEDLTLRGELQRSEPAPEAGKVAWRMGKSGDERIPFTQTYAGS